MLLALTGGLAAYAVAAVIALTVPPGYRYAARAMPDSFETFLDSQLAVSRRAGTRPGNEERLVRRAAGRTPVAILYIHGFGAARGEGELVVDSVAAALGANAYYLRLPGHGTNIDDHAAHSYTEYLDTAEDALRMMPRLGERIVVMATSAGALIATWLAARHPDRVDALVLASPLYEFNDPQAVLLTLPGGMRFVRALYGELRDARGKDPEHRFGPGRERVWQIRQRYSALAHLDRLRRVVARPAVYRRVTAPVLMLYYYQDAEHQDPTANVAAMRAAFAQFGAGSRPHPLNHRVAVADGAHVLLSEHVRTDKALILSEILAFLGRAGFAPAAPRHAAVR